MHWRTLTLASLGLCALLLPAAAQEKADPVTETPATAAPAPSASAPVGKADEVKAKAEIVTEPRAAWDVSCKPDAAGLRMACVMSQSLTLADTSRRLLRVEIVPPKTIGNDNALIKLSLPHGTLLQPGAEIRVDDGQSFRVPFQVSDADGVYTTQPLGSDLIATMKRGAKLFVSATFSDGKKREIPASLAGFSLAYAKIVD